MKVSDIIRTPDHLCTIMIDKIKFMDVLINDLTYTYELSENAVVLHKEQVDLHQFMDEYLKTYENEKIDLEAGSEMIQIYMDPIKLKRVLDNLISNAIKHTAEGTNVGVLIEEKEQTVLIHICNRGDRIPVEIIPEIFTRYYRGQNTDEEIGRASCRDSGEGEVLVMGGKESEE